MSFWFLVHGLERNSMKYSGVICILDAFSEGCLVCVWCLCVCLQVHQEKIVYLSLCAIYL